MHLTHKAGLALALLTAGGFAAPSAHAQAFNAAQDFSATNNPNGVWSYGYETTLGATLNLYTNHFDPASNTKGWNDPIALGVPAIWENFGTSPEAFADVIAVPGQLDFHPGPDDEFSVVRFTAPTAGLYDLNVGFAPVTTNGTTTDVHILQNGASLFSGLVTGTYSAPTSAPSFTGVLTLQPGDTVDFAVGYGTNGNFYDDSTGFTGGVNPVPEASSEVSLGLLLLLSLGGVAVSRRRKTDAAR